MLEFRPGIAPGSTDFADRGILLPPRGTIFGRGVEYRSRAVWFWRPAGRPRLTPKLAPHPGLEPGTTSLTGSFPYLWGPCGMVRRVGIEPDLIRLEGGGSPQTTNAAKSGARGWDRTTYALVFNQPLYQ